MDHTKLWLNSVGHIKRNTSNKPIIRLPVRIIDKVELFAGSGTTSVNWKEVPPDDLNPKGTFALTISSGRPSGLRDLRDDSRPQRHIVIGGGGQNPLLHARIFGGWKHQSTDSTLNGQLSSTAGLR